MKPQGLSAASVSWLFLEQQVGWGARGVVRAIILLIHTHHWLFFGWLGGREQKMDI